MHTYSLLDSSDNTSPEELAEPPHTHTDKHTSPYSSAPSPPLYLPQVKHYAGDVTYTVVGFMDKNKDTFFQDLKRLLYNCKLKALKEMWPEVSGGGGGRMGAAVRSGGEDGGSCEEWGEDGGSCEEWGEDGGSCEEWGGLLGCTYCRMYVYGGTCWGLLDICGGTQALGGYSNSTPIYSMYIRMLGIQL